MTGNKYLVVHGHFYQPPRENPWLDIIEEQESAAPYNDWNERIYDECYRPNAYSRLLDSKGMIVGIHSNYRNMSYNFGPTLFTWMERYHPVTARKIIAADKESAERFGGYGNAVAQVFNHVIMPLASRRDKITQIRWAKHFFKKRFGRDPQGMWLGETAINMETVECLIEEKIGYVILSPNQAEAFRRIGDHDWIHTNHGPLDTLRPYKIFPCTPSGERLGGSLDVFFFNEGLSRAVSFNDELLQDSRTLGNHINDCYDQHYGGNQLVTIATDGETFGHHKPYGDMCLAYFLTSIAPELGIKIVNFGYYLSINPPEYEVMLGEAHGEGRAWSCAHGVGRWSRDCGCSTGGQPGWHQAWRGPFRHALQNLQSQVDSHFETKMSKYFPDPWALRNKYIKVMWEPSLAKTAEFLDSQSTKYTFNEEAAAEIRRLLEAQKFMQFAFTSCAWFFSDISGIETIQNLAYACRALQLGLPEDKKSSALEAFMDDLSKAPSNLGGNGRTLFEKHILPYYHHERLLAFTAAAQQILAVKRQSSYEKTVYNLELKSVMSYRIDRVHYDSVSVQMESGITGESGSWLVLISHGPDTPLCGWVVPAKTKGIAGGNGKPDVWMSHPDAKMFTLADLFYSSRQDLSDYFLDRMAKDTDGRFYEWMDHNELNLNVLTRLDYPIPAYCSSPVGYVLQNRWDAQIHKLEKWGTEEAVTAELEAIDGFGKLYGIEIDTKRTALDLQNLVIKGLEMLQQKPSPKVCARLRRLLDIVDGFAVPVAKSKFEDIFHPVYSGALEGYYRKYRAGNCEAEEKELLTHLIDFARRMNFNTDRFSM
ncbi:MAG: DUF3536 domain-containing protein [Chitinispirillales bacterium]|jgi:alpha-amylase/alpha-mannosidase (GH57 family)|nr:DUF3536 domain-containing protein [Chitinispirillales bacterium]